MIYNRLIVAAIGFIRLEPYDGKLSRTVLRGGKDSNALLLPDYASVEMLHHPEFAGMPSGSRWRSGSQAWNCTDSKLYCKEKRRKDRNGIMAGKTGLPGNYICTTTDGFIFEIFSNGKRNLFGVYGSRLSHMELMKPGWMYQIVEI